MRFRNVLSIGLLISLVGVLSVSAAPAPSVQGGQGKLQYNEEQQYKNAVYHISGVEKEISAHKSFANVLQKDPSKVNMGQIQGASKDLGLLYQKLENAQKALNAIATQNNDVAAAKAKFNECKKALDDIKKIYDGAGSAMEKSLSSENFPDLAKNVEEMRTLRKVYNQQVWFEGDPEKVKTMWGKLKDNKAWADNNYKKYEPLLKNGVRGAIDFETEYKMFNTYTKKFENEAEQYVQNVAVGISAEITQVLENAKKCKDEKKLAWFTGGIKQELDKIKNEVEVMKARPEPLANISQIENDYKKTDTQIKEMAQQLKEEIIASVEAPQDVYNGGDKGELKGMIEKEWKRIYPNDKIMDIRFPSAQWDKKEGWQWDSGYSRWEYYDKAVMPARVIVQSDDKIATVYCAFVNKDNVSNKMNVGAETKSGEYVVEEMLVKNYK